jgi:hypothetical protein
MTIYYLDLLNEIRERLDDVGGDVGNPPAGSVYRWQYDDSGCLWKNLELVNYLNETIREVGLRKPIYDTDTAMICQIALVSGTRIYVLHPTVLQIEEARLVSSGLPLIKTTVKRMRELTGRYRPTENWRSVSGAVTHYLEDEFERKISLYRTPNASDTVNLSVKRLFTDSVTWATLASEAILTTVFVDIPDHYRKALVYGTTALAYRKRDADTFNLDFAKEAEQMLELEVGPKVPFVEWERRRLSANLWRSKSVNEVIQPAERRAKTENDERAKEQASQ